MGGIRVRLGNKVNRDADARGGGDNRLPQGSRKGTDDTDALEGATFRC